MSEPQPRSPSPSGEPLDEARPNLFTRLAEPGIRRPGVVIAVFAVLLALAGVFIPQIRVSTSRYGLVSPKNAYQARLVSFFERFGYPEYPVFVVRGGSTEERHAAIDRLEAELSKLPALEGKVLAHVGPEELAEVLLLQDPEATAKALPAGLGASLGEGVPGWLGALAKELDKGLEGAERSPKEIDDGMRGLARMARALRHELDGAGAAQKLSDLGGDSAKKEGPARELDDEGYLVGSEGDVHLVAAFPVLASDEGTELSGLVSELRRARDAAVSGAPSSVTVDLTGPPALAVDELGQVQRGLIVSTGVSTAGIVVLLFLVFRSMRYVLITLLGIGVGVTLTMFAVRFVYGQLNLITSSFVSVLLGLGDFSVYILSRYSELRRAGMEAKASLRESVGSAGPGVVTGALTTALAFGTGATIEFTAYAELGVISAIGAGAILLTTFLLLPAMVTVAKRPDLPPAPEPPLASWMPGVVRKLRVPIVVAAVGFTVFAAIRAPGVHFHGRYFDFLPAKMESARGLNALEFDRTLSPLTANLSAEGVEEARALTARARELGSVGAVQSGTDLLPPLTDARKRALGELLGKLQGFDAKGLAARGSTSADAKPKAQAVIDALDEVLFSLRQGGKPTAGAEEAKRAFTELRDAMGSLPEGGKPALSRLEQRVALVLGRAIPAAQAVHARGGYLPTDLPPLFRRRFVSKDERALAVFAVPSGHIWDAAVGERFARDVESVDAKAAGLAVSVFEHEQMILRGFWRATGYAALLVLVVLWIAFRSLRDVALSLVPLVMGSLWMFGAMSLLGMSLDVANVVVLPLLLGLSVDSGAQIVHRYRDSAEQRGGTATLDDVLRTGAAVALVSGTTIVGFSALLATDYGGMKSFGLAMTLGMSATLLASLVVLPALLSLTRRAT